MKVREFYPSLGIIGLNLRASCGEEEDKQWATAVIQIQTLVSLLNSLFRRQFMAQVPGLLEPLDVVFQRKMTRLGGLRMPAHL